MPLRSWYDRVIARTPQYRVSKGSGEDSSYLRKFWTFPGWIFPGIVSILEESWGLRHRKQEIEMN